MSDITQHPTDTGKIYLGVVLDTESRRVVVSAISRWQKNIGSSRSGGRATI